MTYSIKTKIKKYYKINGKYERIKLYYKNNKSLIWKSLDITQNVCEIICNSNEYSSYKKFKSFDDEKQIMYLKEWLKDKLFLEYVKKDKKLLNKTSKKYIISL